MKQTIVFDFDGVIHKGYDSYRDGSIYGEIDEGVLDFMWVLTHNYNVVISSCRSATQIIMFLNAYCEEHCIGLEFEHTDGNFYQGKKGVVGVTNMKAVGMLYVDDRGYRYTGDLHNLIDFIRGMEGEII